MVTLLGLKELPTATRLKFAGIGLLAIPIAVLLVFAVGEMAGGDITGSQHILQAAPLLVVLVAGWRYPRVAGVALLAAGPLLFVVWLTFVLTEGDPAPRGLDILMWVAAGLIFFAPPILAGWLLLKASRLNR